MVVLLDSLNAYGSHMLTVNAAISQGRARIIGDREQQSLWVFEIQCPQALEITA